MKKTNLLIIILAIALGVGGWIAFMTQTISESSEYKSYVETGDTYMEKGLYQRAIISYESALAENPEEAVYEKEDLAYLARYEEEPDDTLGDYKKFLASAVALYPANKQLVDDFYKIYLADERYSELYACLKNAISSGYDDETIRERLTEVRYAFTLRSQFTGIKRAATNYYCVSKKNRWNLYNSKGGYVFTSYYDYASVPNSDGVIIVTGDDSRLINGEKMVMGIFSDKITDASVFSEGYVAASTGGKFGYYDEFAEKKFGEYDAAGAFQNGMAAVKAGGKWMLVDDTGSQKSDEYDEIVLDDGGRYDVNGHILVKTSGNEYKILNSSLKEEAAFNCSDTDVLTEDGIIAVCVNGKWGFVNTKGETVIEPSFENAKSFSNGIAAVCSDGKWGFIDTDGKVAIDYQFTDVGYLDEDGICPVRTDVPEPEITENDEENSDTEPGQETAEPEKDDETETDEENKVPEELAVEQGEEWSLLVLRIGVTED